MSTLRVSVENFAVGELTTERAESSYGVPVLVVDGAAHGPKDMLRGFSAGGLELRPLEGDARLLLRWYEAAGVEVQ